MANKMIYELPTPKELPKFYYERFFKRISLIDPITSKNYALEYKIHSHTLLVTSEGNLIDIYILGFNKEGLAPYFDVIMEWAYDFFGDNMNCVILNKGDNPVEVFVDGKKIGSFEAISQIMVHWHDEVAYLAKKWLAFNFRPSAS